MARKSQQAFAKRQRELKKAEKAAQKRLRREERKEAATNPPQSIDRDAADVEAVDPEAQEDAPPEA